MTGRKLRVLAACAAGLAVLGVVFFAFTVLWHDDRQASQTNSSTSSVLIKSDFELVDHTGNPIADEDFKGGWQLVFFGFTYCPDICPTTLSTVSAVMEGLGSDGELITPLFITVDPERDTPEVMADYITNFDPRIIGLTGSPGQIDTAAKAFRVYYSKVENVGAPDDYTMDHSAFLYLMGPSGDYAAHFSHQDDVEKIVAGIREKL